MEKARMPSIARSLPPVLRLDTPVLVLLIFVLLATVTAQVYDPDYFWHLRTGQWIIEHGTLPENDIFSFSRPDAPWVLHEWLFQVVLYGVYALGGSFGVRCLIGLLLLGTFWVIHATLRRYANPTVSIMLGVATYVIFKWSSAPRPQLVTYGLFAVFVAAVLRYLEKGNPKALLPLPLLMVPWVNCHGGFVIGPLFILIALIASALERLAANPEAFPPLRPLLACLAGCVLFTLFNPYHIHEWIYPFQVSHMSATRIIEEWKPLDLFRQPNGLGLLVILLGFLLGQIYRTHRPSFTELALPGTIVCLALFQSRHVVLAAIALAPFTAKAWSDGTYGRGVEAFRKIARHALPAHFSARPGKSLGNTEYVLNWLFLGVACFVAVLSYPSLDERLRQHANAIIGWKAIDYLASAGIGGRGFNNYGFGGYQIFRFPGHRSVFIDGRADLYGDDFVWDYLKVMQGLEGWQKVFDQYHFDYVVCSKNDAIRQLLLAMGSFRQVYADEDNAVLLRNTPDGSQIVQPSTSQADERVHDGYRSFSLRVMARTFEDAPRRWSPE